MNPYTLILEILVALVMLAIVAFSWHIGRREELSQEVIGHSYQPLVEKEAPLHG